MQSGPMTLEAESPDMKATKFCCTGTIIGAVLGALLSALEGAWSGVTTKNPAHPAFTIVFGAALAALLFSLLGVLLALRKPTDEQPDGVAETDDPEDHAAAVDSPPPAVGEESPRSPADEDAGAAKGRSRPTMSLLIALAIVLVLFTVAYFTSPEYQAYGKAVASAEACEPLNLAAAEVLAEYLSKGEQAGSRALFQTYQYLRFASVVVSAQTIGMAKTPASALRPNEDIWMALCGAIGRNRRDVYATVRPKLNTDLGKRIHEDIASRMGAAQGAPNPFAVYTSHLLPQSSHGVALSGDEVTGWGLGAIAESEGELIVAALKTLGATDREAAPPGRFRAIRTELHKRASILATEAELTRWKGSPARDKQRVIHVVGILSGKRIRLTPDSWTRLQELLANHLPENLLHEVRATQKAYSLADYFTAKE